MSTLQIAALILSVVSTPLSMNLTITSINSNCVRPQFFMGKNKVFRFAEANSRNDLLGVEELSKFRIGKSLIDIMEDTEWRGSLMMAFRYKSKSARVICYQLYADFPDDYSYDLIWAVFVEDRFVKFVAWEKGEKETVPYEGSVRSRTKPVKIDDCGWISRQVEREPMNLVELKKRTKLKARTPRRSLKGADCLLILKLMGIVVPSESDADFKRNGQLRDQFNASRLSIGMKMDDVEKVLKAKPLETGKIDQNTFAIYGSNESLDVSNSLCFSNILVVFQQEKTIVIHSVDVGEGWRERFLDIPRR